MAAVVQSLLIFGYAIAPLVLALVALSIASTRLQGVIGRRLSLAMGLFAVPLHELSHLVAAVICRHKIVKVSLFSPSPDGQLGCVVHSYNRRWYTPFTLLFIGLAPLAGGALGFYAATALLQPGVLSQMSSVEVNGVSEWFSAVGLLLELLLDGPWYQAVAWLWLMLSILIYSIPSKADFKGCFWAVVTSAVVFVVLGALSPGLLLMVASVVNRSFDVFVVPLLSGAGVLGLVYVAVIAIKRVIRFPDG